MRKMKLNSKLVLSSLAIVILVMVVTTIAVSIVINRQNSDAAYDRIQNAMNIIRKDLQVKQKKIVQDAQQAATLDGMGGKTKFLYDYKEADDQSITQNTFREIGSTLFNIASTSDIWEVGIYDAEGDLKSFAVETGDETYAIGYFPGKSKAKAWGMSLKRGEQIKPDAWKAFESLPRININAAYKGEIPREASVQFAPMQNHMCLIATAPIVAEEYDKNTDGLVERQFGFSLAVRRLDKTFLADMSAFTGLDINIFTSQGLSIGDLKAYATLKSENSGGPDGAWTLADQDVLLNEIQLEKGDYFQGVLPLFGRTGRTGAIAALFSKDIVKANTWQMIRLLGIIYLACILIIIPLTFLFSNSIARPIGKIISGLTEGSDQVASAAGQVSASSQSLAEGSSEQAASIEETSASLEEMSSMTKQNADNSAQANTLMTEANQVVGEANQSMGEVIQSMDEITKASEETQKIIKTIDEIAFQTNLLALNAAVEAARAGDAGAGFAVVADEVRSLALRAAEAAQNTADLIEETVKRVTQGTGLVEKTNEAFGKVAESASKVGQLVGEISAASQEQAQGIDQVNTAVTDMDKVTQQNAANAEESASAAEQMSAQAVQLRNLITQLVNLVGGSKGQTDERQPQPATRRAHPNPKTGTGKSFRAKALAPPAKDHTPDDVYEG